MTHTQWDFLMFREALLAQQQGLPTTGRMTPTRWAPPYPYYPQPPAPRPHKRPEESRQDRRRPHPPEGGRKRQDQDKVLVECDLPECGEVFPIRRQGLRKRRGAGLPIRCPMHRVGKKEKEPSEREVLEAAFGGPPEPQKGRETPSLEELGKSLAEKAARELK